MNAPAVHRQTPGLSVRDPRGLTVRAVSYWRDSALAPAQARVNRSVIDSVGRVVAEWDPRLVAQPTAPANLTRVYSLSNKVLGSDSVDAGWRASLFAEAGQQVHGWDARGNERWIEYDTLLRPVAVFEQAACVERLHYAEAAPHFGAHNQCGQLIRHDNPAGTQHFNEFGLAGAVLEQHQHFLQRLDVPDWPLPLDERDDLLERAAGARSTLQFNPLGNVLEQTDAQGNRQRFNHTIDGQLREAWLQLKNATVPQRLVHEICYNAQGQVERQTAGNKVTSRFDYCPKNGRLIRLWAAGPGDEPLQDLRYVYDPVGNILSIEDKALPVRFYANQRIEPINRYTYDSLYQLIEATGWEAGSANRGPAHIEDPAAVANYRQTYRYDAGANLLELIHHGPQQHGRVLTAARHSNRCLPEVGGRPPTEAQIAEGFDANGNLLVLDRGRTLSWDARNQLSHVHTVERTLGLDDTERYVYGADGMRQRKISSSQTNTRTVISETRYLPAGLEVRRVDADVMQVIKVQVGRETVQVLHWETPPPRQLAKDQYRYNLSDHLGSCSLELDSEARVISRETYHPFGSTAFAERGDSSEESYRTLRYSGKEQDATGLYYFGRRYYLCGLQRWSAADPAGTVDGLNLYCMVGNRPLVYRDNSGLVKEWVNGAVPYEPAEVVSSPEREQEAPGAASSSSTALSPEGAAALPAVDGKPRWTIQRYLRKVPPGQRNLVVGCGASPEGTTVMGFSGTSCSLGSTHARDFTVDIDSGARPDLAFDFTLYKGTPLGINGPGQFDTVSFEYLNRGPRHPFTQNHFDVWFNAANELLVPGGEVRFYNAHQPYLDLAVVQLKKRGYSIVKRNVTEAGANRHIKGAVYVVGIKPGRSLMSSLSQWALR
ncbi:RHS repeat-associated core domain protein [Pseudomonas sp. 31 R 17]|uniref:RHS repeat domain-containing protein n=1 Tax=Pseudomonas sp. 31 R 17 TaxID=1844101 RepID=UPI0008120F0B|nr:RHS repeat-associated core domain-containing protein [Pseudomonas sp. 31 R 17]CRM45496.1 RHS repeat-associated core domain protein [Pseudomonas sp. 31 R 17]